MAKAEHVVKGKVAILSGTVKAVSPEGVVRVLTVNSLIYADDKIITGPDGSVSIVFDSAPPTQLDLGRMSEVQITEDVYGGGHVSPAAAADAAAEQEAIQTALLQGDQPIQLDATAAGGELSSGGGHPVFVVTPNWQAVTPESGAETKGITWGGIEETRFDPDLTEPPVIVNVSIDDVTVAEPAENTTSVATFTVTLSEPAAQDVVISFTTADGTAISGGTGVGEQDYGSTSGTVTILAGQTSATIEVTVSGDNVYEITEQYNVNLTGIVSGPATIEDDQGIGTILDNDARRLLDQ